MAGLGSNCEPVSWRALRAWRLAGARLDVVVCPERGGAIVSLVDRAVGREWLVQPAGGSATALLRPLTYGSLWSAYEQCGWSEVFPTLGECAHPGPGRAAGRRLPEHGEVWSLPWDDGGDGVASVRGAALSYRLERRLAVLGDSLVLHYAVLNEGPDPLPFQWVPHPLLADALVESGAGWCRGTDAVTGAWLQFDWSIDVLPWTVPVGPLAMPATAAGADLAAAAASGRVRVVAPGDTATWSLRATIGGPGPRPSPSQAEL